MTASRSPNWVPALVSLQSLIPFLERDPVRNIFPLFVCASRPQGKGLAVLEDGAVLGCLVSGHPFGLFAARSGWLVASAPEVEELLMEQGGPELWRVGVQCERGLATRWGRRMPELTVSLDLLLARAPSAAVVHPHASPREATDTFEPDAQVLQLDCSNLSAMPLTRDIRELLGRPSDFPVGSPLFGLWREGQIVAVAEALVRYHNGISIQQVYTSPTFRGRGAARTLVAAIVRAASLEGLTCTYLVEASNEASVRLALSLGFEVVWELACIGSE